MAVGWDVFKLLLPESFPFLDLATMLEKTRGGSSWRYWKTALLADSEGERDYCGENPVKYAAWPLVLAPGTI